MSGHVFYDRDDLPYIEDGMSGELLRVCPGHDEPVTVVGGTAQCSRTGDVLPEEYATEPAVDAEYHRARLREVDA